MVFQCIYFFKNLIFLDFLIFISIFMHKIELIKIVDQKEKLEMQSVNF